MYRNIKIIVKASEHNPYSLLWHGLCQYSEQQCRGQSKEASSYHPYDGCVACSSCRWSISYRLFCHCRGDDHMVPFGDLGKPGYYLGQMTPAIAEYPLGTATCLDLQFWNHRVHHWWLWVVGCPATIHNLKRCVCWTHVQRYGMQTPHRERTYPSHLSVHH